MYEGSSSKKPRVYLAAPLFNDAERQFNLSVREQLKEWVDVYLPQEHAGLVSEMVKSGTPSADAMRGVFELDMAAIAESDALIIVLDGRAVDEGAAFELGVAYTMGKPCIGLQTDSRRIHSWGNNAMIDQTARPVFGSIALVAEWAREFARGSVEDDFRETLVEPRQPAKVRVPSRLHAHTPSLSKWGGHLAHPERDSVLGGAGHAAGAAP